MVCCLGFGFGLALVILALVMSFIVIIGGGRLVRMMLCLVCGFELWFWVVFDGLVLSCFMVQSMAFCFVCFCCGWLWVVLFADVVCWLWVYCVVDCRLVSCLFNIVVVVLFISCVVGVVRVLYVSVMGWFAIVCLAWVLGFGVRLGLSLYGFG